MALDAVILCSRSNRLFLRARLISVASETAASVKRDLLRFSGPCVRAVARDRKLTAVRVVAVAGEEVIPAALVAWDLANRDEISDRADVY